MRCTYCGAVGLEQGFVEDTGEGSRGYARWIAGPLERGLLGGAKSLGRPAGRSMPTAARAAATWSSSPPSRSESARYGAIGSCRLCSVRR